MEEKPDLTVIEGGKPDPDAAPEPPAPKPTTVSDVAEGYARFVGHLRRTYKLTEGSAIKLLEMAWNIHFTQQQMSSTQFSLPPVKPPQEEPDADGSEA